MMIDTNLKKANEPVATGEVQGCTVESGLSPFLGRRSASNKDAEEKASRMASADRDGSSKYSIANLLGQQGSVDPFSCCCCCCCYSYGNY